MKTASYEIDTLDLQISDDFNADQKAILLATLAVSIKHGLADTPISQISHLSGVSIGCMYQNFENRADLLSKLYLAINHQCYTTIIQKLDIPAVTKALRGAEQDRETQVLVYQQSCYQLWQHIYDFFVTHVAHYMYIDQCITADVLAQSTIEESDGYAEELITFFDIGKQLGILKPIESRCISYTIYGSVTAMIRLQYLFGELSATQLESAKDIFWDGLTIKQ